ncbi:MAG: phenylalanine--tRNA ligase subunit beta [Raineya sp.]|jgi:phenylalanyl-tRNA synthetase beta chain|nr:phenylalanine--tRNA ligase subunit beta [Raineya sp.]
MKISYNWLKDIIDITETPEEIGARLTQAGLEVEGIDKIFLCNGKKIENTLEGLVIGEVLTCEKHPNADKLSKTTVDIGVGVVPIVCGASNVAKGQKVVVATVGATLYPATGEPFTIKKAKIRGEESEGMICAEDEIGLGTSHEGIMVLETTLANGTPAKEYFKVEKDYIIEIGLTPNRVDAASHLGVARDLKVLFSKELKTIAQQNIEVSQNCPIKVEVKDTEACPRYAGLLIENVKVQDSPDWLKNRIKAIGLNPINNIVDATNYVLHHLGQPLHAFDADKIEGKTIIVKKVTKDTPFVTLDSTERKLSEHDLMICDAEKPLAIAGVFGGLDSGVTGTTKNIFIESAYFHPDSVRKTSQFHGLKTDASFRFERGTDPNMPVIALRVIAKIILDIAGGEIKYGITDVYPKPIEDFKIKVLYKNIDRLIGKKLEKSFIKNTLTGLEIKILEETEEALVLQVPPYRVDVQREADIVEEILRIYGFNNIEISDNLSSSFIASFPKIDKYQLQNLVNEVLTGNGFYETITNSLTKPAYAQTLKHLDENKNVVILNKLSEELEVLRQSLIFSGLEVLSYNINRKQKDLKIFEFGKVYHKKSSEGSVTDKYGEKTYLSIFVAGNTHTETWQETSKKAEFHFLAGIVDKVLRKLRVKNFKTESASPQAFAYGLNYSHKGHTFAQIGELQPYITKHADLKGSVLYAELDWDWLVAQYQAENTYQEISKFPEVRRDLSLILDKSVTYQVIEQKAFELEKKLLKRLNAFSVYEGEQIGEGKKSYAISFFLQDDNQTLTDAQIDKTMQKLMEGFKNEFGAIIRD